MLLKSSTSQVRIERNEQDGRREEQKPEQQETLRRVCFLQRKTLARAKARRPIAACGLSGPARCVGACDIGFSVRGRPKIERVEGGAPTPSPRETRAPHAQLGTIRAASRMPGRASRAPSAVPGPDLDNGGAGAARARLFLFSGSLLSFLLSHLAARPSPDCPPSPLKKHTHNRSPPAARPRAPRPRSAPTGFPDPPCRPT